MKGFIGEALSKKVTEVYHASSQNDPKVKRKLP